MLWFEQSWLLLLVDVSVKSLALALVAWFALTVLRVQNANVRHRVWAAVLLGMVALPLLVPVTPTVPIPAWMMPPFPTAAVDEPVVDLVAAPQVIDAATDIPSGSSYDPAVAFDSSTLPSIAIALPNPVGVESIGNENEAAVPAIPSEIVSTNTPSLWSQSMTWLIGRWRTLLFAAYFIVVLGFAVRIIAGIWGTRRIVARSVLCSTADDSRARKLNVYESGDLKVPLTVGFLRPKILLPADWRSWTQTKLESVLAHETAHIRRGDYLVSMLAECNRALHWFNPLSWMLRRWLSDLAEQNCDDAVISSTGERAQYARHLLEVASSLRGSKSRVAWSGVAMARRPNVEVRIDAILDSKRPLAQRLGNVGAMLLIATAVPAVLLAAALRPGEESSAAETAIEIVENDEAKAADHAQKVYKVDEIVQPLATGSFVGGGRGAATKEETSTKPDKVQTRIFGQVLGPNGKGTKATVHLVSVHSTSFYQPGREEILAKFETDANGSFDVEHKLPPRDSRVDTGTAASTRIEKLVATAKGSAPGVSHVIDVRDGKAVSLKLAEATTVEGTILNLEGQPVVGATIRVAREEAPKDLDKLLNDLRVRAGEEPKLSMMASFTFTSMGAFEEVDPYQNERWAGARLKYSRFSVPQVTTDQNGRFRLAGLAKDSLVTLDLSGPGIVKDWVSVVTRDMKPIGASSFAWSRTNRTFGTKFSYSAEPEKIIEGTLTDIDTGKPIPGVTFTGPSSISGFISATTDANGMYRLTGLPKSKQMGLDVITPKDAPYFGKDHFTIEEFAEGLKPTTLDLQLKKTTWVTGTVRDKITGKPVRARVVYSPHSDNKAAVAYELAKGRLFMPQQPNLGVGTDADGKFRIRVVPGEGLLAVKCEGNGYCPQYGFEALDEKWKLQRGGGDGVTNTYGQMMIEWMHGFKTIDANLGETALVEIEVDPGNTLTVNLVDAENQPVSGVLTRGRIPNAIRNFPSGTSTVDIKAIEPDKPRSILFFHRKRNLGAFLAANQTARKSETAVVLEPCGIVRGRLLTKDGKPMDDVTIGIRPLALPDERTTPLTRTNEDGTFELTGFTPSTKFWLGTAHRRETEIIASSIELKPGETRDLGDIQLNTEAPKPRQGVNGAFVPTSTPRKTNAIETIEDQLVTTNKAETTTRDSKTKLVTAKSKSPFVFEGQVLLPNARPAAGAFIAIIATQMHGDNPWHAQVLAEATADSDGRYEMQLKGVSNKTHSEPKLIARTETSGIAWTEIDFDERQNEVASMVLRPQQLIQAKLVDFEGSPAANLDVELGAIRIPGPERGPNDYVGFFKLNRAPKAWIQPLKTDEDGLLTIPNVASGHGVFVNIPASDKFAPQDLALNTGLAEERTERDGTYRSIVKNMKPGEIATIPISPAKIFEGVVVLGESGKLAANAKITMWASQQEIGSMVSVESNTDANGRFKLIPKPGIRFGIQAFPPEGTPYQVAKLDDLRWSSGDEPKNIKIVLPRCGLATGTVVDTETGAPLSNGSVQYHPKRTNPNRTDNAMFGWQGRKKIDAHGQFSIPVLAGEGTLLIHAMDRKYVLKQRGSREVSWSKPGGQRWYAHAFEEINPSASEAFSPLRIEVTRGETVALEVVDPDDKPVSDALVISRLKVLSLSPFWRGFPDEMSGGRFTAEGLAPSEDYTLYFLDAKRKLGATVVVNSDTPKMRVVLEPCGSASVRYFDADGNPAAGMRMALQMVVTPGYGRFAPQEMRRGETLAADQDFASNIDRLNYEDLQSDENGLLVLPALVPGAHYRYTNAERVTTDFVAVSGETHDIGEIKLLDD